jgi:curved DNA-binding protein
MTDFYQTLGVSESASQDEIKKAYRKLANQHHPDKGGDQAKFKDISVAYETLGDANKRAEYDQHRKFGNGTQFHFNSGDFNNFHDIFGGFGHQFGGGFHDIFGRRMQRNRDLNIQCQISLLDSFLGKELEANYKLPSGRQQTVVINLPPGIGHGETIRYNGLGDDSIPNVPKGALNVTVVVMPDDRFQRVGDDLYTEIYINPIEAIIGCRKRVTTITGKELELDIRPGVDFGTEFAQHGGGFTNPHTRNRGRFVSVVKFRTPQITDALLIDKLRMLNDEINSRS